MKKVMLTFVFALAFTGINAQNKTEKELDFNKWSLELSGGFNKTQRPMSEGYFTSTPSPYVADLGVRYMFNNKFGLKADFGYNNFTGKNNSLDFDSRYYRADIQAVANLGRIMSFETWTNTIGLLGHAGFGLAQLEDQNSALKDRMGNFIAGVTGQIKLSNRLILTGDFTTIINTNQNSTFDATSTVNSRGFNGILFNATVGLTVYLGKNQKHADWMIDNGSNIDELKKRITDIETSMLDTDKDGVADYLDQEPNTISGIMVDVKGKSTDLNNNNIPDELENYLAKTYAKDQKETTPNNNKLITNLINEGYVCTYFDYNKTTPTNISTEGIDFVLNYLRKNPLASVAIIGHADELGRSDYNDKLSNDRAVSVKSILVKAGIDASRLNVVTSGEDTSVEKDSEAARKLVRKVNFRVQY